MSDTLSKADRQKNRTLMGTAGWVCAVENLHGVYVPDPRIGRANTARAWAVSESEIRQLVEQFSQDPEVLSLSQVGED